MIAVKTGKPGAGKSYAAFLEIVEELRYGTRDVVTNLPVLVDELEAYFQRHMHGVRDMVDVRGRVRLIEKPKERAQRYEE